MISWRGLRTLHCREGLTSFTGQLGRGRDIRVCAASKRPSMHISPIQPVTRSKRPLLGRCCVIQNDASLKSEVIVPAVWRQTRPLLSKRNHTYSGLALFFEITNPAQYRCLEVLNTDTISYGACANAHSLYVND